MASNTINVEADLYVLLSLESEAVWGSLSLDKNESWPRSFIARQEEVTRRPQPVPPGMSDWRYELIEIDEAHVRQRAVPHTIPAESIELIPDTLLWHPIRIVSASLKSFLEKEFPGGGHFYPFFYRDAETGETKPAGFWYWLPRHYLDFVPKEKRGRDQLMRPQVWGSLCGQDTTWEMYHNKDFQNFASKLPYWTPSANFGEVVFRTDVYARLMSEGFSGFVGADADNYLRHTPEQSVGYIHFGG